MKTVFYYFLQNKNENCINYFLLDRITYCIFTISDVTKATVEDETVNMHDMQKYPHYSNL